jgi:LysR family glycine cleavage system transcriptional activator
MDLAIRHGKGEWRGVEAAYLLEETAMPVCAPGYLEPADDGQPPAGFDGIRLIVSASFPDEWEEWARARGIDPPATEGAVTLDAQEQALQLAATGHGLAMGRHPVVDDWLAQGRLIAPFGDAEATGAAYYLCKPTGLTPSAAARRAEHWLIETAALWRGPAAG